MTDYDEPDTSPMVPAEPETATKPADLTVSGIIRRLFHSSPGFSAGKIAINFREYSFSVKGHVSLNEPVTLTGAWKTDPRFGRQFVATGVVYELPTVSKAGAVNWLQCYAADIGPVKANQLVEQFGTGIFDLCVTEPAAVANAGRIPIESINRVAAEWTRYASRIGNLAALLAVGMTEAQANAVFAVYGGNAANAVKEDPYQLMGRVTGFGWKTTDEIALKMGFTKDCPARKRAALVATVQDFEGDGYTCAPVAQVIGKAAGLCEVPPDAEVEADFAAVLQDVVTLGRLVGMIDGERNLAYVALPRSHRTEAAIWKALQTSRKPNPHAPVEDADALAERYGTDGSVTLDETQVEAIRTVLLNRITFITGGAGAGKTLVARAIARLFTAATTHVYLCAPTGKAAKRLTDVVGKVTGGKATTIHRLLGYSGGRFEYDERRQLPSGVLICDEVSMVDSSLAAALLAACGSNIAIVFIGDPNQLPPVGAGALLRDTIDHELAPVVTLGKCHRQAGPLKASCAGILSGDVADTTPTEDGKPPAWVSLADIETPERIHKGIGVMFSKYFSEWGYDPVTDCQFLTARHAGALGTTFLNRLIQWLRQKARGNEIAEPQYETKDTKNRTVFHIGDKVIQTSNNYDTGIMNGTIGTVRVAEPKLVIEFEGHATETRIEDKSEISLAYAITPHKAQGSEWPCVVNVVPKQHKFQQHRHWLYTAVTRSKSTCVVIGDRDAIYHAAQKVENNRRVTCLGVFATCELSRPA